MMEPYAKTRQRKDKKVESKVQNFPKKIGKFANEKHGDGQK